VTKGLETYGDALAAVLMLLETVDPKHQVNEMNFGTFSSDVGGGKYYIISISYALGNTLSAKEPHKQDTEYRIRMAVRAFEDATREDRS
jgi:hypothetical protein